MYGEVQRGTERYREVRRGTKSYREVQRGTKRYKEVQRGIERNRKIQRGTKRYREVQKGLEHEYSRHHFKSAPICICHVRFTKVPFTHLLDLGLMRYPSCSSWVLIIFYCDFFVKVIRRFMLQKHRKILLEFNIFQRYRCVSGIQRFKPSSIRYTVFYIKRGK